MPAFLLLAKVGRVPLPIPWFPIWMILLPVSCLVWLSAEVAGVFVQSRALRLMRDAPRMALALSVVHGMRVQIVTGGKSFSLLWM